MSLVLVTPPSEEPISLTAAKAYLRLDDTNEDAVVASLIAAARDYAEQQTGRALLSQQWNYTTDRFPRCNCVIRIMRAPLISVQSITYVDTNGATQTLASNQYAVDLVSPFGEIRPVYGVSWPTTRYQPNAVSVSFTAGYADVDSVPSGIKSAMLLQLNELYLNRESSIDTTRMNENRALRALLDPYVLPVL